MNTRHVVGLPILISITYLELLLQCAIEHRYVTIQPIKVHVNACKLRVNDKKKPLLYQRLML